MSERLNIPRIDYVSVAPYMATMEWDAAIQHTLTFWQPGLAECLFWLIDPDMAPGQSGAPDRRVLVDARGETIFGYLADPLAPVCHVITSEVAEVMRAVGLDEDLAVLDLELEMLFRQ